MLIGGFIVQGTYPKSLIIRALGPELTQYGVPNALANPTLELHNGGGLLIASNDNWERTIIGGIITQNQVRDIINSGYAPSNGLESAIIADLPPGNYTAIVRGFNDTVGVALVEVYDSIPILYTLTNNSPFPNSDTLKELPRIVPVNVRVPSHFLDIGQAKTTQIFSEATRRSVRRVLG